MEYDDAWPYICAIRRTGLPTSPDTPAFRFVLTCGSPSPMSPAGLAPKLKNPGACERLGVLSSGTKTRCGSNSSSN